jgi:dUTP pyrophosphatase
MYIKKLSDAAVIPTKSSNGAAGYDLFTTESHELKPGERRVFKTDIAIAIPSGFYGRISSNNYLAVKHGIGVLAEVIDNDYHDEILVALINLGDSVVQLPIVKDGKSAAIAQVIFESYHTIGEGFVEVDDLTDVERVKDGFNSGDVNKREIVSSASKQMKSIEQLYESLNNKPQPPTRKYVEIVKEREQKLT